jgi:hypothetical protein
VKDRRGKALAEAEEFPEKKLFPILLGQGEKPLLLRQGEVKVSSQEESLGGIGMQKSRTRSFPPLPSCTSLTLPFEFGRRSEKFQERKFID